ncbi:DUF5062 family protein [Aliivibrio finisterrensis]|uniref:DUF5062 family protein n=1 Tax=Aliivibrio finisterrensis TaxID=511998 RepID=A0A6N6RWA9_9GAMM|nr:DUF5062 family protein [Aliivibrio finisterrensis]KAB2826047.1 DUF5062 family protein [Aliivibrio finisterrensis]
MKNIVKKDEDKLFKKALELGCKLSEMQGYHIVDKSLPQPVIAKAVYLFLVQVRLLSPLPLDKTNGPNIKHRLAIWMKRNIDSAH